MDRSSENPTGFHEGARRGTSGASDLTLPTVPELIRRQAAENPDKVFIVDADHDHSHTFRDFEAENHLWGKAFVGAGVEPQSLVLTMLGASVEGYHAWLGISHARAIEVPVNPELKGRMLAYVLGHTEAALLVTRAQYLGEIAKVADQLPHLRKVVVTDEGVWQGLSHPFEVLSREEFLAGADGADDARYIARRHDISCIIYTSGTTGPPKGVIVPWGQLTSQVKVPDRVSKTGTRYSYLPPAHMSGKGQVRGALMEDRTLVLRESFSTRRFWDDVRKYDCRVTQLWPALVRFLLDLEPTPSDRDNPLAYFWMAPLIPEIKEFMERFDVIVGTGYGMTEVGGPILQLEASGDNWETSGQVASDPRGYEVRLVDDDDQIVGPNEIGEMIVRTSVPWSMNVGYFRNPELTAKAWRNGWFHTGDALRRDDEGNFYFVDRFKDCIRRRGENISSFEVEAYVTEHPSILEAAAVGVPSENGEEEVMIYVTLVPSEEIEPPELGAYLATAMPKFMVPRYIEIVEELPKTPATGRIMKSELRQKPLGPKVWDREK
jgi:crotonobetaine/carnitine-CoA ligase